MGRGSTHGDCPANLDSIKSGRFTASGDVAFWVGAIAKVYTSLSAL